jgi:uncharacterized protein Yka (UPF0111/DUF47 family)
MPAEKRIIIEELGEAELLLPGLVNAALVANDRIKYYFTLLLAAIDRADHPDRDHSNLRVEREGADIDNALLDGVVAGAVRLDSREYLIPYANEIFGSIRDAIREMYRPVLAADGEGVPEIGQRMEALLERLPNLATEPLSRELILSLTSGDRGAGDSLHLLVMDLHRVLNEMQRDLSRDTIDGARAYLLDEQDPEIIAAFMRGVNRTAPLKFDHPGLGTTATRTGRRLVIQNDIGLTDAHVLVVTVEDLTVSITYTDVHMPRLQFFQSLFETQFVAWADTLSRRGTDRLGENLYHLSVGKHTAADADHLNAFLTYVGSRLVFLIDWNRARKRLQFFLRNRDAIAVLKWAADNECGHMAFLNLGGERLIYEALELAVGFPLRYGEPLHQTVGREKTMEYFQWVMRSATTGLLAGRSRLLLQDEIKTELLGYFRSAREELVAICEEHATFTSEVAAVLSDSLLVIQQGGDRDRVARNAFRAKRWERQADELVGRVRSLSRRIEAAEFFFELIGTADDILDSLEEACFFTTLVPPDSLSIKISRELGGMADIALLQGQAFVRALVAVRRVQRGAGNREEMQHFLEAVDRIVGLEQECDDALRKTEKTILEESSDFKEMRVAFELARMIEDSTNAAMKAAFILRDNILEGMKG